MRRRERKRANATVSHLELCHDAPLQSCSRLEAQLEMIEHSVCVCVYWMMRRPASVSNIVGGALICISVTFMNFLPAQFLFVLWLKKKFKKSLFWLVDRSDSECRDWFLRYGESVDLSSSPCSLAAHWRRENLCVCVCVCCFSLANMFNLIIQLSKQLLLIMIDWLISLVIIDGWISSLLAFLCRTVIVLWITMC